MGFVVDKVALGQVFSGYFGFPYQSSFHQFLHNHHHPSSVAGTIGFHRGGPGSNLGLVIWDLWWTKWRWDRFSPVTLVSPANFHSINFSTITITYHPGLVQ
jgi:hypothetical protein